MDELPNSMGQEFRKSSPKRLQAERLELGLESTRNSCDGVMTQDRWAGRSENVFSSVKP